MTEPRALPSARVTFCDGLSVTVLLLALAHRTDLRASVVLPRRSLRAALRVTFSIADPVIASVHVTLTFRPRRLNCASVVFAGRARPNDAGWSAGGGVPPPGGGGVPPVGGGGWMAGGL